MNTRRWFLSALGVASMGVAPAGPVSARHIKCETHIFGQSRSGPNVVQNYGWTIFPGELGQCFWVDQDPPPKPTTPWQGSASGYGQVTSSSNAKRLK